MSPIFFFQILPSRYIQAKQQQQKKCCSNARLCSFLLPCFCCRGSEVSAVSRVASQLREWSFSYLCSAELRKSGLIHERIGGAEQRAVNMLALLAR